MVPWLIKERDNARLRHRGRGHRCGQAHHLNRPAYYVHGNNRYGAVLTNLDGAPTGRDCSAPLKIRSGSDKPLRVLRWRRKPEPDEDGNVTGRMAQQHVALVTGGSAGIGTWLCRTHAGCRL